MAPANDREDTWQDWAIKAQQGDKKSYSLLLKDLAPYIRNVITPALANPDWAEDIVQEVLISIHKSLKTYDPERSFKPWLFAIISFRKTDFLRKHYNRRDDKKVDLENAGFQKTHVTEPLHAGELKDVESAMQSLPEKQQHILRRVKIEGYTAQEVANEMGMTVSAVKVSVHRSLNKVKEKLENDE